MPEPGEDAGEAVEVDDVDTRELAARGVDVARHREVHEHAGAPEGAEGLAGHDVLRRTGRGPHDIGGGDEALELGPVRRVDGVGRGEVRGALVAAVDHGDLLGSGADEGGHGDAVHRAGTDDDVAQDRGVAETLVHPREPGVDETGAHVVEVGVACARAWRPAGRGWRGRPAGPLARPACWLVFSAVRS